MASIVVVTHNTLIQTRRCVTTLREHTDPEHEIIVVDNASQDGTRAWLASQDHRLQLLLNEDNRGFAPAVNQGVALSRGDVVVMLNADVLVPPSWLPRLSHHLEPGVGAVGPLATACGPQQNLLGVNAASQAELLAADRHLRSRFACQSKEVGFLAGFCLALTRDTFDRVGGLDASLRLGADDFDLCYRLRRLGLRLLVALDLLVYHAGHASFEACGAYAEEINRESWEQFERKWAGEITDLEETFFGQGAEPVWYRPD